MEYVKCGDYYIPNLELGFTPRPIGRWGRLRRDYLRQFRPITYHAELLSGALWEHTRLTWTNRPQQYSIP